MCVCLCVHAFECMFAFVRVYVFYFRRFLQLIRVCEEEEEETHADSRERSSTGGGVVMNVG